MTREEAIDLIRAGVSSGQTAETWFDLGCGSGVFTNALATLLGAGNRILALDIQPGLVTSSLSPMASIEFHQVDFVKEDLPIQKANGILMANALHYVEHQIAFIDKLKDYLKSEGKIIIVEYDTDRANRWVPFPVSFAKAVEIFSASGFKSTEKIGERKSIYQAGQMYACVISPNRLHPGSSI
jgi:trans-aconitate methyltransferase